MARHTKARGRSVFSTRPSATGKRGAHRAEDDRKPVTGTSKVAAVVALGALASVGAAGGGDLTTKITPLAGSADLAAAIAVSTAPDVEPIKTRHEIEPGLEAAKLMRSEGLIARQHVGLAIQHASNGYTARQAELKRQQEAAAAEAARVAAEAARVAAQKAAEEAARRPKVAKPAEGSFTSGFGARWGTTHYGVDIANSIGTPILSAMDGVIIEAGPASGFGLWVRVQHGDGTVTIYGHVNEILVSEGQQVHAGQQIATMGNRGQSTGPHLHFEVWIGGSQKIDPIGWLGERGINL